MKYLIMHFVLCMSKTLAIILSHVSINLTHNRPWTIVYKDIAGFRIVYTANALVKGSRTETAQYFYVPYMTSGNMNTVPSIMARPRVPDGWKKKPPVMQGNLGYIEKEAKDSRKTTLVHIET
jgi:hypothetical protein